MMDLYIKLSVCVPRLIPGRGFYAQISSEITSEFLGVTATVFLLSQKQVFSYPSCLSSGFFFCFSDVPSHSSRHPKSGQSEAEDPAAAEERRRESDRREAADRLREAQEAAREATRVRQAEEAAREEAAVASQIDSKIYPQNCAKE